jgi:hypothetical protein
LKEWEDWIVGNVHAKHESSVKNERIV